MNSNAMFCPLNGVDYNYRLSGVQTKKAVQALGEITVMDVYFDLAVTKYMEGEGPPG